MRSKVVINYIVTYNLSVKQLSFISKKIIYKKKGVRYLVDLFHQTGL